MTKKEYVVTADLATAPLETCIVNPPQNWRLDIPWTGDPELEWYGKRYIIKTEKLFPMLLAAGVLEELKE